MEISDTIYAAVDHIVEHRVLADGSTQYRVRWEKQGPELDSWLFEKDFVDYGPLQSYSKAQGIDLRTKKVVPRKVTLKLKEPVPAVADLVGSGIASTVVPTSLSAQVNASPTPIEIYLNNQQKEALGDYWKSTTGARRQRNQPIVESDSEDKFE